MPIYEYRCQDCRLRFSQFLRGFQAAAEFVPVCPRCQSRQVKRLVSRVYSTSDRSESDDHGGSPEIPDFDESDPRSMGKWMRKMGAETGENLGPEFEDVVGRLEAGQDPEQIERELPGVAEPDSSESDLE